MMSERDDEDEIVGVSFKIPRSLRQEMKLWATQREMTLTQVFILGFEGLKEAEASGEGQLKLFSRLPGKPGRT